MGRASVGMALWLIVASTAAPAHRAHAPVATEIHPDPRLSRPLDRWPNDNDLARLRSVEGQPRRVVLFTLGHPSAVERRANGIEVWRYPWQASCRVYLRGGVCVGTDYTSGY